MRPSPLQPVLDNQLPVLFALDGLANVIDFAFHFWMGRVLIPSDFAILQTLNSVVLVYATASGVFQPVVARFVAEARGNGQDGSVPAIFRSFFEAAFLLGFGLSLLVLAFSNPIAQLLNLPVWTVRLSAILIVLGAIRPVPAGVLQGQENFAAFGLARLGLSLGRIILVFFLLQAGLGLTAAVAALPFGWLVSVLLALLLLNKSMWKRTGRLPGVLRQGWKLAGYALLAYAAYMSLTSLDLVWINRTLGGDQAGAYSSLILMRRVVALLPGVAVTVMFPRIAKTLAQGRNADKLLAQTAAIILAASGTLAAVYFIFSEQLISLIFGTGYMEAAPLLGWMGLAMTGVSLSSIWLNYALAEQPAGFVILLGAAVILEWIFLRAFPPTLQGVATAFGATGWLLALSGLVLYAARRARRESAVG